MYLMRQSHALEIWSQRSQMYIEAYMKIAPVFNFPAFIIFYFCCINHFFIFDLYFARKETRSPNPILAIAHVSGDAQV